MTVIFIKMNYQNGDMGLDEFVKLVKPPGKKPTRSSVTGEMSYKEGLEFAEALIAAGNDKGKVLKEALQKANEPPLAQWGPAG